MTGKAYNPEAVTIQTYPVTENANDPTAPDGFNAWILREFGPDADPEQVVTRLRSAWDAAATRFDAAHLGEPVLYEINFRDCQTPWFTIPAKLLPEFLRTGLKDFEYRPLYRGATRSTFIATNTGDAGTSTSPIVDGEKTGLLQLIATLRQLANHATPGPWAIHSKALDDSGVTEVFFIAEEGVRSEEEIFAETLDGNHDAEANAAYIAGANPEVVLRLCAALEQHLK